MADVIHKMQFKKVNPFVVQYFTACGLKTPTANYFFNYRWAKTTCKDCLEFKGVIEKFFPHAERQPYLKRVKGFAEISRIGIERQIIGPMHPL